MARHVTTKLGTRVTTFDSRIVDHDVIAPSFKDRPH